VVAAPTTGFYIEGFYTLPTQHNYVFYLAVKMTNIYFPTRH